MKGLIHALALSAATCLATAAGAAPYVLSNGSGDGQVTVGVDGFGSFGSNISGDASTATYNPVGSQAAASTVFQSGVAIRIGSATTRTFLSTGLNGGMANPVIVGTNSTSATSAFTFGGLLFMLNQSVTGLFNGTDQNGSRLDQAYTITNSGAAPVSFELVRYLDGDLNFDNSITTDGGGLIDGAPRTLFETDTATGSSISTTFVGIDGLGGTQGSYEIASYDGLRSRVINGIALANTVQGDGPDADTFIDVGAGYDVTLAMSNLFTLGAGASTTYTTQTIFGTGAPEVFTSVPEPASWALMIAGFGSVGVAMRRRRRVSLSYL